jgi:AcrR family transcriptional regulator
MQKSTMVLQIASIEPQPRRSRGRPRSESAAGAVLDAAWFLMAEQGLKGATMDAITLRSGVSKMTIYKWWGARLPLLIDAFLRQATRALPLAADGVPMRALKLHAQRYVSALDGELGQVMRAVIAECMAETGTAELFYKRYLSERRELGSTVIRAGQDQGSITRHLAPEALYDQIYGTIFYRFLFGMSRLNRRFVTDLVEHVLSPR